MPRRTYIRFNGGLLVGHFVPLTKNMLADMHCIFTIRIWRRRKAFKSNLILFGPAAIALSFSESELPRL